jgi:hypothetical protein
MNGSITFIQLVLTNDTSRVEFFKKNKSILPELKLFRSVDGFNISETRQNLNEENLEYTCLAPPGMQDNAKKLENHKPKWGTLACWLTKYKALKWQVQHKIPYMCFIEDDLLLGPDFKEFCYKKIRKLEPDVTNIIRLGKWGEGYITSYETSQKVLYNLYKTGIMMPIDDQLRVNEKEYSCSKETPWLLAISSGAGERTKTKVINNL